jgi:hypothetical protein
MTDIEILQQLLNGNHLNDLELERASKLLFFLKVQIKGRIK